MEGGEWMVEGGVGGKGRVLVRKKEGWEGGGVQWKEGSGGEVWGGCVRCGGVGEVCGGCVEW